MQKIIACHYFFSSLRICYFFSKTTFFFRAPFSTKYRAKIVPLFARLALLEYVRLQKPNCLALRRIYKSEIRDLCRKSLRVIIFSALYGLLFWRRLRFSEHLFRPTIAQTLTHTLRSTRFARIRSLSKTKLFSAPTNL